MGRQGHLVRTAQQLDNSRQASKGHGNHGLTNTPHSKGMGYCVGGWAVQNLCG